MVVELECQVKLAEQYKASLDTVQQLHCKCQEEAGKMRSQLLAKEADLSHVLTALQLTATQVGVASPHPLSPDLSCDLCVCLDLSTTASQRW